MKLLIIGGGIYVKGSEYNENGTIIPSVLESIKENYIDQVGFVTTSNKSVNDCLKNLKRLSKFLNIKINSKTFIKFQSNSKTSYKKALKKFKPDATIVATPDHTHYKICRDVIFI